MNTRPTLRTIVSLTSVGLILAAFFTVVTMGRVFAADALTLTNTSLVFNSSQPVVLTTNATTTTWEVKDVSGDSVKTGTSNTEAITLDTLPQGYYTVHISNGETAVDSSFIIIGAAPAKDQYYGTQAPYSQYPTLATTLPIPVLRSLGFSALRGGPEWYQVEQTAGNYTVPAAYTAAVTTSEQQGIETYFIAAYGNVLHTGAWRRPASTPEAIQAYADYIDNMLETHPSIQYVEIYNEYNAGFNDAPCKTGTCYAAMMQGVYEILKPKYPTKTFIAGGILGRPASGPNTAAVQAWVDEFFAANGYDSMDAFSYHPYSAPPWQLQTSLEYINQKMLEHGPVKPLILSEVGWSVTTGTTGNSAKVTDDDSQADRLVYTFVAPRAVANATSVNWYNAVRGADITQVEAGFGIFKAKTATVLSVQPTKAAYALYYLRTQLDGYNFSSVDQTAANQVTVYTFANQANQQKRVAFRQDMANPSFTNYASLKDIPVDTTFTTNPSRYTSAFTDTGALYSPATQASEKTLAITYSPVYLVESEKLAVSSRTTEAFGPNSDITLQVVPAGGVAPYTYAFSLPTELSGLSVDSNTGALSGTVPGTAGNYIVNVTIQSADGQTFTYALTINVTPFAPNTGIGFLLRSPLTILIVGIAGSAAVLLIARRKQRRN